VWRYGWERFAALARKVIYRLQRLDASGICGDDHQHKTLWDEFCHEVQWGPSDDQIELAAMPDGDRLCHGDLHPLNILGDVDKPMIVDWPDACRGDPAADVCRSYVLLTLHASELAAPYLHAYCRLGKISRQAILDWLPYVAAAKLAEKVPGEADGLREILRGLLPTS
jgi:fructosamine-3-kinase